MGFNKTIAMIAICMLILAMLLQAAILQKEESATIEVETVAQDMSLERDLGHVLVKSEVVDYSNYEPYNVADYQRNVKVTKAAAAKADAAYADAKAAAVRATTVQAATHGRTWYACETKPPAAQSPDMQAEGLKPMQKMMCTAAMTAEELCCAPWESVKFDVSAGFAEDSPKVEQDTANLLEKARANTKIVEVCTEMGNPFNLLKPGDMASIAGECSDVTEPGETETLTTGKSLGLRILESRVRWFLQQGIDPQDLPTCKRIVKSCANGESVLSVSDEFLAEVAGMPKANQDSTRLSEKVSQQPGRGRGRGRESRPAMGMFSFQVSPNRAGTD